jgi:hypothetical protein
MATKRDYEKVDRFNETFPIGTEVRFWTGLREGDGRIGWVKYEACVLGDHTPGVYIRGEAGKGAVGFVALTHIEPVVQVQAASPAENSTASTTPRTEGEK